MPCAAALVGDAAAVGDALAATPRVVVRGSRLPEAPAPTPATGCAAGSAVTAAAVSPSSDNGTPASVASIAHAMLSATMLCRFMRPCDASELFLIVDDATIVRGVRATCAGMSMPPTTLAVPTSTMNDSERGAALRVLRADTT
jgi:hypothetical protein